MGMYTEIVVNTMLENLSEEATAVLDYMAGNDVEPETLPARPLFSTGRWAILFSCSSYYFVPESHCTFRYDDIAKAHLLMVRADLKNYDQEIQKFFDWIDPYVEGFGGEFIGYYRHENDREPTLVYKKEKSE
jgi:hypothetical protein